MTERLGPAESRLVGCWLVRDGRVVADAVCERIGQLVANQLVKVATRSSGWCVLLADPADGRLWELTYPHGHQHGGGPPSLTLLTADEARDRFGDDAVRPG